MKNGSRGSMDTSGEFLGFLLAEGVFHLYRALQTYPGWLNLFFHQTLNVSGLVVEDLKRKPKKTKAHEII